MAPPITCECGHCRKCKHRVYMKDYYSRNAEQMRETARKSQARTRTSLGRHLEYLKRKQKGPPDPRKIRARNAVTHARERGELAAQPCELATEESCRGRLEAHHEDYDRPLDVRWLCQRHHAELHRRIA